jgi:hypothetical protein
LNHNPEIWSKMRESPPSVSVPVMKIPQPSWKWNSFLFNMLQILPKKLLTVDDSYLSS